MGMELYPEGHRASKLAQALSEYLASPITGVILTGLRDPPRGGGDSPARLDLENPRVRKSDSGISAVRLLLSFWMTKIGLD